jgi:hypothetical protein
MKFLAGFLILAAFALATEALSPMRGPVIDTSTQYCTYGTKVCSGNTACFTTSSIGACCGGCTSGEGATCGACRSGYTCVGGGCSSIWIIVFGCLIGLAVLCSILSYVLKQRYYDSSGSATVIVATQTPVYEETTVYTQTAPPQQQAYVPDTYVSTTTVVGQPQAVVTYPSNQYGAPAGATYVTTTTHEAY